MSKSRYEAPVPWYPAPAKIAVLLSGRGSNFVALADACERGELDARIVVVVSDRADAAGLLRAAERGIPSVVIERSSFPDRAGHEEALRRAIEDHGADLVCLAGFMRVLSAGFVERLPLRILNIHPSLLPSFPGLEAQAQALRHGVRVSGATVHFVDSAVDSGPIILQEAVPVLPADGVPELSARILETEHRVYSDALKRLLAGGWVRQGRTIRFP